jgi:hypothetical protein
MESVPINASKRRTWFKRILWIPVLYLVVTHWDIALPTVNVHYSKAGQDELRYIWNVNDRIYKGGMLPGGGAVDNGVLFPDDEFFMEFSWWSKKEGRNHCISISPKWPNTDIYLDADGNIDMRKDSGTDADRLKECQWDRAKP